MTDKKLEDKTIEELGPEDFPKLEIKFAPGAFDDFEGSQEELDELVLQIQNMIKDGSLFEKSRSVDLDELLESDDPADQRLAQKIMHSFDDQEPPQLQ